MDAARTLPHLLYRHALEVPEKIAFTSIGQGSVTWARLWETSRQWAGWLKGNGVAAGDHVATLIPQSLEAAYVWMGCCSIGAVEVSINCEFRGEWLRNALRVSSSRVIVLSTRYLDQLLSVLDQTNIELVLLFDDFDNQAGARDARIVNEPPGYAPRIDNELPNVSPGDIACILFTSGTTGQSKAVQVAWSQLYASCATTSLFAKPGTRHVYYLPYSPSHATGRSALYCAAITCNETVVREAFSASSFWDDIRKYQCTWTAIFGAAQRIIANMPESSDDTANPLVLVYVNPLLPMADALGRRFGFEIYSGYGTTEIGNAFLVPPGEAISANAGRCGRPIEGLAARIVDDNDAPVPTGVVGELVVRSEDPWMLTPGYYGAPEATAQAWRNGWFHTGDLGRFDDAGNFYYLDRSKDMIRRRGENISSFELEAAVLSHTCVAEVAAVGVPSTMGDEDVLIAVVPKAGARIDPAGLTEHLTKIVPRFAVPRFVRVMEALPKTVATLRVQKQAIRADGVTADTWDRQQAALGMPPNVLR